MANDQSQRDLVLAPGEYAFIQDRTQGALKICTGPSSSTPSQSDVPVRFDPKTQAFLPAELTTVVQKNAHAEEGSYIILKNPAKDGIQPKAGLKGSVFEYNLQIGSKVVIPGPANFPLWPQQSAETVEGHHLKSNQYLLVRVYNEELARKSWEKVVMRPATQTQTPTGELTAEQKAAAEAAAAEAAKAATSSSKIDLTTGKLHVIKGTDVSFFIPPSGVEVVAEGGKYVRDALTLEQKEYCILVDENGRKRYEKGPQVVFPTPTEKFSTKDGAQKQEAVELNALQGLHVKAIADCETYGVKFKAGEEYFITGAGIYNATDEKIGDGVTIYYPREELAFVRYDGKTKIFAVTVPEGEGRYVLNRLTGEITTERGPRQLLPNPCKYVIVRRVLTDKQCSLFYPGNFEALAYNQMIAGVAEKSPTTRAGALSEGDLERATKSLMRSAGPQRSALIGGAAVMNYAGETSRVSGDQKVMGDEFERSSGYTAPRTLTLNTKYQGAVAINVWTGYAVQVVSKTGDRKLVQGPATILLDYDEELEAMEVSTGKPKNTDNLLRLGYLRVEHNKVSDVVRVETSDHVEVEVKLSYKINFTGDSAKWFSVENYVKFFCDHARSMLKGAVRKIPVETFYSNSTDIVREILLGKPGEGGKRPGLFFPENGMRMDDFEVLGVSIVDQAIQKLLGESQLLVVRTNVELANAKRNLEVTKTKEQLSQAEAEARAETQRKNHQLQIEQTESQLSVSLAKIAAALKETEQQAGLDEEQNTLASMNSKAKLEIDDQEHIQHVAHLKAEQDVVLAKLKAEVEAIVERFNAAKGGMTDALVALSDKEVLVKLGQALNIQQIIGGESVSDAVAKVFAGSPVETLVKRILTQTPTNGQTPSVQPKA